MVLPVFINGMMRLMVTKFMTNDMPHAAGLITEGKDSLIIQQGIVPYKSKKYRFWRRTPKGSAISLSEDRDYARVEVTSMEDANKLSTLLNGTGIKSYQETGVSKVAWEETSPRWRKPRGPASKGSLDYPGITFYFSFSDLEYVISQIGSPLRLEAPDMKIIREDYLFDSSKNIKTFTVEYSESLDLYKYLLNGRPVSKRETIGWVYEDNIRTVKNAPSKFYERVRDNKLEANMDRVVAKARQV